MSILKSLGWISFLISLFIIADSYAQESKTKEVSKNETETTKAKMYTEDEFRKELEAEIEKRMKRMGHEKLVELSKELLKRENELRLRELELNKMKDELDISQKEFAQKVVDFQGKQNELIGCIAKQSEDRQKRISHMVDVVSNMKPEVAAQILSVQESDLSVEILGKLDAGKVSKVFNLMDKEVSARLQKQYMNMKR